MNIDIANQGMTLKVKEKANLPISPVGLRFLHFAFVGIIGAVLAPFGLVFLWGRIDSSFKSLSSLKAIQGLPVLGVVHGYRTKKDTIFIIIWIFFALIIITSILSAYAYVGWLKATGGI